MVCVCACVQALVQALPELLPMIQTHLLDLLSLGLTHKPYRENLPTATAHSLAQAIQLGEGLAGPCFQPLVCRNVNTATCRMCCCCRRCFYFCLVPVLLLC